MIDKLLKSNIAIVGGGNFCKKLLQLLFSEPFDDSRPILLGVADINQQAKGWLYAKTGKGKLQFLQIRDGSGYIQGVMFRPNLDPEVFEASKRLTQESAIVVTGTIKAETRAN